MKILYRKLIILHTRPSEIFRYFAFAIGHVYLPNGNKNLTLGFPAILKLKLVYTIKHLNRMLEAFSIKSCMVEYFCPPTCNCKLNQVIMPENYFNMQDNYVYIIMVKRKIFVKMRDNYVKMQEMYANMLLITTCQITCMLTQIFRMPANLNRMSPLMSCMVKSLTSMLTRISRMSK